MSEKYDGMRLFWDGNSFFTRQGRKITLPEFITNKMPKIALDGELWYIFRVFSNTNARFRTQYGLPQDAISLISKPDDPKWQKAVFWVFDMPNKAFGFEVSIVLNYKFNYFFLGKIKIFE